MGVRLAEHTIRDIKGDHCLKCTWFKLEKGWQFIEDREHDKMGNIISTALRFPDGAVAFCSAHLLTNMEGEDKKFLWKNSAGYRLDSKIRTKHKFLKGCTNYEGE